MQITVSSKYFNNKIKAYLLYFKVKYKIRYQNAGFKDFSLVKIIASIVNMAHIK